MFECVIGDTPLLTSLFSLGMCSAVQPSLQGQGKGGDTKGGGKAEGKGKASNNDQDSHGLNSFSQVPKHVLGPLPQEGQAEAASGDKDAQDNAWRQCTHMLYWNMTWRLCQMIISSGTDVWVQWSSTTPV